MGRARDRLFRPRLAPRADAPAGGLAPRLDGSGDPARVVRGAGEDSAVGLCHRAGNCRLPGGAKHQSRHRDGDSPPVADVPHLRRRGHSVRHDARLRARALKGAAGYDGGVGLLARRGDRHGADGQRVRRRHEARRRHAISPRRLRRARGLGRRPGVDGVRRRGAGRDPVVPPSRRRPFPGNAGARRRGRGDRRQSQDPGRRPAPAAVHRRRPFGRSRGHDHAAALASRRILCARRLVHRPQDSRARSCSTRQSICRR